MLNNKSDCSVIVDFENGDFVLLPRINPEKATVGDLAERAGSLWQLAEPLKVFLGYHIKSRDRIKLLPHETLLSNARAAIIRVKTLKKLTLFYVNKPSKTFFRILH